MRIENQGGDVVHVALDPAGEWASSTQPHFLILTDYDEKGTLYGVTFGGPLAYTAFHNGAAAALEQAVSPDFVAKIKSADGNGPRIDYAEIETIAAAFAKTDERLALAS